MAYEQMPRRVGGVYNETFLEIREVQIQKHRKDHDDNVAAAAAVSVRQEEGKRDTLQHANDDKKQQEIRELHSDRDKENEGAKSVGGNHVNKFEMKGARKCVEETTKGLRDRAESQRAREEKKAKEKVEAEHARTKERSREAHPKLKEREEKEISKNRAQKAMDDSIANSQERAKLKECDQVPRGTDAAADTAKEKYIARNKEAKRVSKNKESKERPSEKTNTKSFEERQERDKNEGKGKHDVVGKTVGKVHFPQMANESNTVEIFQGVQGRDKERNKGVFGETKIQHAEKMNKTDESLQSPTVLLPQKANERNTMKSFQGIQERDKERNKSVFGETKIQHADKMNNTGETLKSHKGGKGSNVFATYADAVKVNDSARKVQEKERNETIVEKNILKKGFKGVKQQPQVSFVPMVKEPLDKTIERGSNMLGTVGETVVDIGENMMKHDPNETIVEKGFEGVKEQPEKSIVQMVKEPLDKAIERGSNMMKAVGETVAEIGENMIKQEPNETIVGKEFDRVKEQPQKSVAQMVKEPLDKAIERGSNVMGAVGETVAEIGENMIQQEPNETMVGKGFDGVKEKPQKSVVQMVKEPLDKAIESESNVMGAVGETVAEIGENMIKQEQNKTMVGKGFDGVKEQPQKSLVQMVKEPVDKAIESGSNVMGAVRETVAEIGENMIKQESNETIVEKGFDGVKEQPQKSLVQMVKEPVDKDIESGSNVMGAVGETVVEIGENMIKQESNETMVGKGFERVKEKPQKSVVQMVKEPLDKAIESGSNVMGAVGETVSEIGENMMKQEPNGTIVEKGFKRVKEQPKVSVVRMVKEPLDKTIGRGSDVLRAVGETVAEIGENMMKQEQNETIVEKVFERVKEQPQVSVVQMVKAPLDKATERGSNGLGAVGETVVEIGGNMMKPAEKVREKAEEGKEGGVFGAIGETVQEISLTTKVLAVGEGKTESKQRIGSKAM